MAIAFHKIDKDNAPVLVCVPGLLGGPEAFQSFIESWGQKYSLLLLDLDADKRVEGLTGITPQTLNEVNYDHVAKELETYLLGNYPGRKYYFVGVSLGGKIIYDFFCQFPHLMTAAVTVDVGPGFIDRSELFFFVRNIIHSLNMNQVWSDLKKELISKVPEKNLRILIQTQIYYPDNKPPAQWRRGIMGLEGFISRQGLHNQWPLIEQFAQTQKNLERKFTVLHATIISGIDGEDLIKTKAHPFFEVKTIQDTTHFMFVTHKEILEREVLALIND